MKTETYTAQTELMNAAIDKNSITEKDAATVLIPQSQPNTAITVQVQNPPKNNQWSDPSILGPLVAIVAILATSWNALQDRKTSINQAKEEQKIESRKVLFSQLIEDLKEVAVMISNLPNEDVKNPSRSKAFLNFNTTINKVWLWAEIETICEIRKLQLKTTELYFDALIKSLPLVKNKVDIDEMEEEAKILEAQRDAVATKVNEFKKTYSAGGIRALPNVIEEQELGARYTKILHAYAALRKKIYEFVSKREEMNNDYTAFIAARQPQSMDQINLIMKMAREELGAKGNTEILDKQTEEIKEFISKQVAKVQKETENIFKS